MRRIHTVALVSLCVAACSDGDPSRHAEEAKLASISPEQSEALAARFESPHLGKVQAALRGTEGLAFTPRDDGLEASFETQAALRMLLPASAERAATISVRDPQLAVAVRLQGARPVPARLSGSAMVYPEAGPHGSTLVVRSSPVGLEDYLTFEAAPREGSVSYDLELSPEVAGLRLVSDSLELMDGNSVPRLRVEPPYLVDAKGELHAASLDIVGCAVDRDPASPWGRAVTPPGAHNCLLRVTFDPSTLTYPAVLDPAWTSTANMATARSRHTATRLGNGKVLVAGGANGTTALRSAELYDPATRTWAATGSMPAARSEHTATARTSNGTVIVVGGASGGTALRSAEVYNPTTGRWSALPTPLVARRQHTATLLANGELLVSGGRNSGADLSTAEVFSNNVWSATSGSMLAGESGHTANLLGDGTVLIVGPNAPASQLYNPTSRSFVASATTGVARRFHTATTLGNGTVLLSGGANGIRTSERYDPTSGRFILVGSSTFARQDHTATLVGNRVVLVGGPNTQPQTATETFNWKWDTFAPAAADGRLITPRSSHTATLLTNGQVLIAGGVSASGNTTLSVSELYDPTSLDTVTAEYQFPPAVDSLVLAGSTTEIWGSLTRPATLVAGKRYPVLAFLHGNHTTCRNDQTGDDSFSTACAYANTGTCPTGTSVIPNHRGYDYIAEEVASRGYFVISVNTNRGINCHDDGPFGDTDLVLARGRMLLRHLEKLSLWNRGFETTPATLGINLKGWLDFGHVGLLGHSRGGEGVRAAYAQYRDIAASWPGRIGGVGWDGIFEIGPVDGKTSRVLNPDGTRWNVLLPACDGDVVDLDGARVFDRMVRQWEERPAFKSTYEVWGANHNFYNTEWRSADNNSHYGFNGCLNHQALTHDAAGALVYGPERQTGLLSALTFFTANVGATRDEAQDSLFDSAYPLALDYRVSRGYHPGGDSNYSLSLEDFVNPTGTSSYNLPNQAANISMEHVALPTPHAATSRGAAITWSASSPSAYFQSNFAVSGAGLNLSAYQYLDLRLERNAGDSYANVAEGTFLVRLVNSDDSLSGGAPIEPYVDLVPAPRAMTVLQTARIPLTAFSNANLASVRGVRLEFSTGTMSGTLYVANIRATRATTLAGGSFPSSTSANAPPQTATVASPLALAAPVVSAPERITQGNSLASLRSDVSGAVEVTLSSSTPFKVGGSEAELVVGKEVARRSQFPSGSLQIIRFSMDRAAFDRTSNGDTILVRYGTRGSMEWDFGKLDKSRLDR